MVRYFPIANEPDFDCLYSDLAKLEWTVQGITADFVLADPAQFFRVRCMRVEVVRVLDEMPLSTEENDKSGLVPHHFAYRVEGSLFWKSQSGVLQDHPRLQHYRFITGSTCLDVLAMEPPVFELVNAAAP